MQEIELSTEKQVLRQMRDVDIELLKLLKEWKEESIKAMSIISGQLRFLQEKVDSIDKRLESLER